LLIPQGENQVPVGSLNLSDCVDSLPAEIGVRLFKPPPGDFQVTARVIDLEIPEKGLRVPNT